MLRQRTSVPGRLQHVDRKLIRTAFLIVNPIIVAGAFWNVNLANTALLWLPLFGIVSITVGGMLAMGWAKAQKLERPQVGSMFVAGAFSNMGNFGSLICFLYLGEGSLAFAAMFRLLEQLAYFTVCYPIAARYGNERQAGDNPQLKVMKDPFVLANLAAISIGGVLNATGWSRPEFFTSLNELLVPIYTLLIMISVGMTVQFTGVKKYWPMWSAIAWIKFIVLPIILVTTAWMTGIQHVENGLLLQVVFLLSTMPVANLALIPPKLYGLDVRLASANWLTNNVIWLFLLPVTYYVVQVLVR